MAVFMRTCMHIQFPNCIHVRERTIHAGMGRDDSTGG